MPSEEPLLTIAIPTFNRRRCLEELLETLAPQLVTEPRVELIVSDNACTDGTPSVLESFRKRGLKFRHIRNETNVGADGNFLQCFREASGKYFWLFGDDDILIPGALSGLLSLLSRESWDLAFVRPYAFRQRYDEIHVKDPLGRFAMKVGDPVRFARHSGIMLTFISSVIVNREKFVQLRAPDPARLVGTNLIQLGWVLPLLARYERGLIIFGGLVAGRRANSGGYDLARVFGQNFREVTATLLTDRPDIAEGIFNSMLRGWFPGTVVEARRKSAGDFEARDFHKSLKPVFGANPRYWFFVYPAIKMPIAMADALVRTQTRFIFRIQAALAAMAEFIFLRKDYVARSEL